MSLAHPLVHRDATLHLLNLEEPAIPVGPVERRVVAVLLEEPGLAPRPTILGFHPDLQNKVDMLPATFTTADVLDHPNLAEPGNLHTIVVVRLVSPPGPAAD